MDSHQTVAYTPFYVDEGSTSAFYAPEPPPKDPRHSGISNPGSSRAESGPPSIAQHSDSSPLNPHQNVPSYLRDTQHPLSHVVDFEEDIKPSNRRRWVLGVVSLLAVVSGVVLGVYFGVVRRHTSTTASAHHPSQSTTAPASNPTTTSHPSSSSGIYGGDGTTVTTEQGTTFTYSNKFGGYFVYDPSDPFNNNARAQSWTPPLNQTWDWSKDQVLGVNLGGWLVLEPFITPALYQKYTTAIDEWTLHTAMAADIASGGFAQLEEHYKTFITEEDFAQIAGAGLNWIRLPIPFWAIDTWEGEPFLPKVCWKYALKAFDWARKYGLRILLDLHSTPGSQNGYNHSGQSGKINLLNGVMGIANAQRLLHYIRIITEFISQPQYKDVVPMFGIVNEPTGMPMEPLYHFYLEAHRMIRDITGVGAGNGPYISLQGGAPDLPTFSGSDRIALEQHPYFAFDGKGSLNVVPYITAPCSGWSSMMTESQTDFGVTTAGEFSLAFNDCGLMLRSAADEHTTHNCSLWDIWENYTPTMKQNLMDFAMANMDALHHWFFWTWKVGPSAIDNSPRSPLWSYKLGLDNGWIPQNPRDANGHCSKLGVQITTFDGAYQPYQTGGLGAGTVNAEDVAKFGRWPPTSIGLVPNATLLPTYTPTGTVPTLPPQTYASPTYTLPPSFDAGNGWYNSADTAKGMTTVAGCPYPNAWDATAAAIPRATCTGT